MDNTRNDISDEQLDDLFRRSLGSQNVEFEPAAWQKMNDKLDAYGMAQDSSFLWKKRLLLLMILGLFVGSSYWYVSSKGKVSQKNDSIQPINISKKIKIDNKQEISDKQNNINNSLSSIYKPENSNNELKTNDNIIEPTTNNFQKNKNSIILESETEFKTKQKTPSNNDELKSFSSKNNKNEASESVELISRTSNEQTTNKIAQTTDNQSITKTINNKTSTQNNSTETATKTNLGNIILLSGRTTIFFNSLELPNTLSNNMNEIEEIGSNKKIENPFFAKGFSIHFSYSPDFSTVAQNDFIKVGSNVGLLAEYRFGKRWSLQTGVIRSLKVYEAYGSQYEINLKWNAGVRPESVTATCKMLDIPINIRYDITQKPHSRLFASTGLTSYAMLNEDYQFMYSQLVAGVHYSWIGKTGNYYGSNLNFSMGYEQQFFKKLSWQLEPFARLPISNIGYGKVKLITIGAFLSVKYRL